MIGTWPTGMKKWLTGASVSVQPERLEPAKREAFGPFTLPRTGQARVKPGNDRVKPGNDK
jgi:hypothetical protein